MVAYFSQRFRRDTATELNNPVAVCKKIISSTVFSKICETTWMAWGFFVVGINYSVLGPTLLDLQLFLNQDLETLSTIPLSSGIGETTGMFCTLWLSKFGHKRLQLSVSLLLSAAVISVIPITNSYIYVDVMFFIVGFISAVPSCFLMDVCSELWKDKGTTFQFILVGSSLGAILTPIIVEPFLCHGGSGVIPGTNNTNNAYFDRKLPVYLNGTEGVSVECSADHLMETQGWCLNYSDNSSYSANFTDTTNVTKYTDTSVSCVCSELSPVLLEMFYSEIRNRFSVWQNVCGDTLPHPAYVNITYTDKGLRDVFIYKCCPFLDSVKQCGVNFGERVNTTIECTKEDSNVRTAYVVLGFILLPTSFAFFYYWWRRDSRWATDSITESQRHDHAPFDIPKQGRLQGGIFYTLLFLSFFPITALTIVFATYLTAFGVEGQLQLPKSTMVFMTSVFWLSTLVGRIFSTVLTPFLGHTKIIIFNFAGMVVSAVLLVVFAPYNVPVLWVSTVLLGFFCCPYEGAGVAWAADYVGMSSNLVLLSWISVSAGNLVFPFIGGIMFENIGPTGFLYLLAGQIGFMVIMFALLQISVRFLKK